MGHKVCRPYQRSGVNSIAFTQRRWVEVTEMIHDLTDRRDLIKIMMALVYCALAKLISIGKIIAADIFVFARATHPINIRTIELTVDQNANDPIERQRILDCGGYVTLPIFIN